MRTLNKLAGIMLFIGLVLTISNEFLSITPKWLEGVFVWAAGLILFIGLAVRQKKVITVIALFALASWLIAWSLGDISHLVSVLTTNQSMIVMLMGVQFLQLVAIPKDEIGEELPKGKSAFIRTYLGVHFFGSVINLSSVLLVADRLVARRPLTQQQQILLTRAFSSAANWSPFFAAFAAAMVFAPEASLVVLIPSGLGLACMACLISYFDVVKIAPNSLKHFVGYPVHFQALWLPAFLAALVLVAHYLMPSVKVIVLIALCAVLISAVVLFARSGLYKASVGLKGHVITTLPTMKNELLLFLIAGVFGGGLAAVLDGLSVSVPFEQFDGVVASIILLMMFALAILGVHPVISIAVIGHWLSGTEPNQTLLAMMFLMSWALGVSTSPISGMNLALQGRYGVSGKDIFQWNLLYAIKMYLIGSGVLLASSHLLGIGG